MTVRTFGVKGRLDPSLVRKVGASFAKAWTIIGQLCANAFDARATKVEINVAKNGDVEIIDDGTGMAPDRFQAFIGMGDPGKEADKDAIGRNGTAVKCVFMSHMTISVVTATADNPEEYDFAFSDEQCFTASTGGAEINVTARTKSDPKASIRTHGTRVSLKGRRTDEDAVSITEGTLLKHLARELPPWRRSSVTVNGKKLTETELTGKFYESGSEGDLVEGVGPIHIVFGVADKRVRPERDKTWGSWGEVCDHGTFVEYAPDQVQEAFPEEFAHPMVWFRIAIPAAKDFESLQTRNHYKESFYKSGIFARAMAYLRRVVLPLLRKILRTDVPDSEDLDATIRQIMESLQKVGETNRLPPDQTTRIPREGLLRVNPTHVSLLTGAEFTFGIQNTDPESEYEVDASASGGEVWDGRRWTMQVRERGMGQIRYRAGRESGRRYQMKVTRRKPDAEVQTAYVAIRLATEVAFAISPQSVTLAPRETSSMLTVKNDEGKRGLVWSMEQGGEVMPVEGSDGRQATVKAGTALGEYRVICTADDGAIAETRVTVREEKGQVDDTTSPAIKIGPLQFEVRYREACSPAYALSWTNVSKDYVVIYINFLRPAAVKAREQGRQFEFMLAEVVFQIAFELAEAQADGAEPTKDDVNDLRSDLMDKLFG